MGTLSNLVDLVKLSINLKVKHLICKEFNHLRNLKLLIFNTIAVMFCILCTKFRILVSILKLPTSATL